MISLAILTRVAVNVLFGTALGLFFFGGLWLTSRSATHSPVAALLVIPSFFLRSVVVVLGLYWMTAGIWQALLACMVGFLIARTVLLLSLGKRRPSEARERT